MQKKQLKLRQPRLQLHLVILWKTNKSQVSTLELRELFNFGYLVFEKQFTDY